MVNDMNYFIRVAGGESDVRFAEAFRERMSRELRTGNFFRSASRPTTAIRPIWILPLVSPIITGYASRCWSSCA